MTKFEKLILENKTDNIGMLCIYWDGIYENLVGDVRQLKRMVKILKRFNIDFGNIDATKTYGIITASNYHINRNIVDICKFVDEHPIGWDCNHSFIQVVIDDDSEHLETDYQLQTHLIFGACLKFFV